MSHFISLVYKNYANHFDSRAIFVISKAYLSDGNIPIGYFYIDTQLLWTQS